MFWGYHLRLDCRACNDAVESEVGIYNFVKELVPAIDMQAYGEPQIVHVGKHDPKVSGYTLIQMIETSAITGHFVDINGDAYLDIFSCKEFDTDVAVDVVKKHFAPENIIEHYDERQA